MFEMKKFLSVGVACLALMMGFSSCNKDKSGEINTPETDTYVGLRIAFPGATGTRALPEDYNKNGEWKGRDKIQKISVYLVYDGRVDHNTYDVHKFFGITPDGFLAPNLAVKAKAGEKVKAYVVINDVQSKTDAILNAAPAAEFDAKFKGVINALASDVSKYENGKDIVMMTNDDPTKIPEIEVEKNVTAAQANAGVKNRLDLKVSRVVSRAIVTLKKDIDKSISVNNAKGNKVSTITISEVKYAVGQSNKSFYLMRQADWKTPEYDYVPTTKDAWKSGAKFDYSDLTDAKEPKEIDSKADVKTALEGKNGEQFSKFVLPITHEKGKYKKGNITYFEITCKFLPDKVFGEQDEEQTVVAGSDFYLGMTDGKFYTTRELAEKKGQQATKYTSGVMKYVIWLNPNGGYSEELITESPTVRNQVYHAHITGFKEIGVPNNPLNPDDPNDPDNPDNPIDPTDDPESNKTYLSASITVLPWTMHSYEVDLSNRY